MKFGTDEQRQELLPRMATGEIRAAFSLSEPEVGSDVQGIKSTARKAEDGTRELNGQKMWVTNGLRSGVVFVPMKTDPKADPPHRGMTCFITEKEPARRRTRAPRCRPRSRRWATRGSSPLELVYDGYRCPPERILGGEDKGLGQGFAQDDGRARGGARERRRARRGDRPARAGACAALLAGARRSASRSRSTRRSSSSSPTWPRRSRQPGC